jgi:1,4-alpha-glucan branching enzyme
MKYTNWKDAAEIIGIAAIVASLLFVGLELRQSQQIAIGTQYQERAAIAIENTYQRMSVPVERERQVARLTESLRQLDLSRTEQQWLDNHSEEALAARHFFGITNLYVFDNNYFQYQSGLMTDEAWLPQRARLKDSLRGNLVMRSAITQSPTRYRASFVTLCRELLAELESEAGW